MSRFAVVLSITVLMFFVLLGSFVVQGQRPEAPAQPNQEIKPIIAPPEKSTLRTQRIREGTTFKSVHVSFRQHGDRTVLYTTANNQRFTCLENLTLERILTAQEKSGHEYWKIDGEYTEFRGENYVLIRRAAVAEKP